ncbi:protein DBF4 homolog A-like, partial [Sinocyclocheilus grahami]|uniref:protein DBF4 homolog A-like n=1 Tax=Sinocyclocheilus grahami TaxID=75366 RepID=UPI0007AD247B
MREQRSGGERGIRGKKGRRIGHEGREKRKGGYCECCEVKFDNLKMHLESDQHQAFSKSEEYTVVDRVTAGLTCDLINIGTHSK